MVQSGCTTSAGRLQPGANYSLRVLGQGERRLDVLTWILFILCETEQPPLERIGQVLKLLQDAPYPVEPIVYTAEELERRRDLPFMRRVLQEGKVLYERRKA